MLKRFGILCVIGLHFLVSECGYCFHNSSRLPWFTPISYHSQFICFVSLSQEKISFAPPFPLISLRIIAPDLVHYCMLVYRPWYNVKRKWLFQFLEMTRDMSGYNEITFPPCCCPTRTAGDVVVVVRFASLLLTSDPPDPEVRPFPFFCLRSLLLLSLLL